MPVLLKCKVWRNSHALCPVSFASPLKLLVGQMAKSCDCRMVREPQYSWATVGFIVLLCCPYWDVTSEDS